MCVCVCHALPSPLAAVDRERERTSRVQAFLIEAEEGPNVRGPKVHLFEDVPGGGELDLELRAKVREECVTLQEGAAVDLEGPVLRVLWLIRKNGVEVRREKGFP